MKDKRIYLFLTLLLLVACGPTSEDGSSEEPQIISSFSEVSSSSVAYIAVGTNTQNCTFLGVSNRLECEEKTYKTVIIDGQIWMAENLNFGAYIESYYYNNDSLTPEEIGVNQAQTGAVRFCFRNIESNCGTYGGLYQWHTAMGLSKDCMKTDRSCEELISTNHHQGICPVGWHIPKKKEWDTLVNFLGGYKKAGFKIKTNGFGGQNESGFSAIGTSSRYANGYFGGEGLGTAYWEAEPAEIRAGVRSMVGNNEGIFSALNDKNIGYSVRCLKD